MFTNVDFLGLTDADLGVLAFKAGQEVNDNFAVEARLGFGVTDDELLGAVTVDADYFWGLYVRGGYKIERTNLYALLGFAGEEATLSMAGFPDESYDDTGLSYGLGVGVMVTDKIGLNFEYLVLPDIDVAGLGDIEVDSFNLGVSFMF